MTNMKAGISAAALLLSLILLDAQAPSAPHTAALLVPFQPQGMIA